MHRRRDIRKEAERLTSGQINRRRFVMSALATGVTMPTAMSLATKAQATAPRRGGHLAVTMLPGHDLDALLEFARGNGLTEVASNGQIVGDLAHDFTPEHNGARWIIDLRSEVTFSDGTALTADHVVESLNRVEHPLLSDVTDMRVLTPHQLAITLSRPDTTLPAKLAAPGLTIRRRTDDGDLIGTGGYRIDGTDGPSHRLTRRPEYWKADRAFFDSIAVTPAASQAVLQADVMAGHADYAAGIAPETVAFLAHLPNVDVSTFPATRALVLHPTDLAPATHGRQAIGLLRQGVDRQAFIDRALLGHGLAGDDTPFAPSQTTRANTALTPNGTPLPAPLGVASETTQAWLPHLADLAQRIGVPLETAASPSALLQARTLSAADLDRLVDTDLRRAAPDVSVALDTARKLSTDPEAIDTHAAACTEIANYNLLFVPAWASDLAAHSTRLMRPDRLSPNLPNDGHRMLERWWMT